MGFLVGRHSIGSRHFGVGQLITNCNHDEASGLYTLRSQCRGGQEDVQAAFSLSWVDSRLLDYLDLTDSFSESRRITPWDILIPCAFQRDQSWSAVSPCWISPDSRLSEVIGSCKTFKSSVLCIMNFNDVSRFLLSRFEIGPFGNATLSSITMFESDDGAPAGATLPSWSSSLSAFGNSPIWTHWLDAHVDSCN